MLWIDTHTLLYMLEQNMSVYIVEICDGYSIPLLFLKSLCSFSLSCFSVPGDSGMSSSIASSDSHAYNTQAKIQSTSTQWGTGTGDWSTAELVWALYNPGCPKIRLQRDFSLHGIWYFSFFFNHVLYAFWHIKKCSTFLHSVYYRHPTYE